MDFLAETNVAGQTVLRLVSRGNAIIAELLRLSDHIPGVFRLADKETLRIYGEVIFDFQYLKKAEFYEHRIENNSQLMDLDQEFKDNHIEILKRFYHLFESIYKYVKDYTQYLDDLEEGVYIQHTLEGILLNNDGKQLLAEALYLYGVMLLLMDEVIDGVVRERILISYLRYKGHAEEPLLDEVCKLCKQTGFIPNQRKPPNYPEEFFARIPLSKNSISMIIGRLRSDDIYNQIANYPLPQHRSAALATQASMLYIILYFSPEILYDQNAVMREIVDKHFPDNWVITYYIGFVVDLSIAWEGYRAAKAALSNTIQIPNVTRMKDLYWSKVDVVLKQLDQYLTAGVLVEEFVLDNLYKLLATFRESNVVVRWLMLHTNSQEKKIRQIVLQDLNPDKILGLLLNTAQYEFILKTLFNKLLQSKQSRWETLRKECSDRMIELGEYFSGDKPLTRVKRNEALMKWCQDLSVQINGFDYNDYVLAGRKISQLIQALERVEEFHQIESSLQVKQFLIETRAALNQMLRIVNVKEEVLVTMQIVSDMAYGWQVINDYVNSMQATIKRDPSNVLKLRATFLKLSSILQMPLVRISQAASKDLFSVSEYYSGELVSFVRKVLEIVPRTMFETLAQIIDLQTTGMRELPTKVEKDKLYEFAQLDQRYHLARLTHSISMFTEGILAMDTTLVGIIKVVPKQILEDGIRKQLVLQIAAALDRTIQFKTGKIEDFIGRLKQLSSILDGIKRSFQYIQDYLNIYGLKIWQEEFSRIVNYNIEQECNSFLKTKVYDWQSVYQSTAIPIPKFPPIDGSVNFIGRLARELLSFTNPYKSLYIDQMSAWYDKETGRELVGIKTFELLSSASGAFGLAGLDKLLCFMMVKELQQFLRLLRRELKANKEVAEILNQLVRELSPTTVLPKGVPKVYVMPATKCGILWPEFLNTVTNLGHMQLIRKQIALTLNISCKTDSNLLYSALFTMNKSVMKDIQAHYRNPEANPYISEENPLLEELTDYLETAGIGDPYSKIYITTATVEDLPCLLFLFVISQIGKFTYSEHLDIMLHKKDKRAYDGTPFVIGIITFLKQFHFTETAKFIAYMGQYVRGYLNRLLDNKEIKLTDFPEEATSAMNFLEEFFEFGHYDRKILEGFLPPYIFDYFKH